MNNPNVYIETRDGVENHLIELRAALRTPECELDILPKRGQSEMDPYSTIYTMNELEYDSEDVKHELETLTIADYIENMKDSRHPYSTDFHVFGKNILEREVYIKEKLREPSKVFCISFHFAQYPLKEGPYQ